MNVNSLAQADGHGLLSRPDPNKTPRSILVFYFHLLGLSTVSTCSFQIMLLVPSIMSKGRQLLAEGDRAQHVSVTFVRATKAQEEINYSCAWDIVVRDPS
jgi:hypothetical protein